MKKMLKITSIVLAMSFLLSACGSPAEEMAEETAAAVTAAEDPTAAAEMADAGELEPTTINLYTGGSDNVRVAWEAVIAAYHAKGGPVTVELQFIPGGSGNAVDNLIAAIEAEQETTDIDVMDFGENELFRIVELGGPEALEQITAENVPNSANIIPKTASNSDRAMPYRGTTVILAYNSETVPTPPATPDELYQWIMDNPQRFAYNDPTTGGSGSSFVTTAVYNQMPIEAATSDDPKWMEEWDAGFQKLAELHPYMYMSSGKVQYPAKNQGTLDLLNTGEIDMCPAWADMVIQQVNEGKLPATTKIAQLDPAFTGQLQLLVVPSIATNKEASFDFLNYVASPEAQALFIETQAAIPVIDAATLPPAALETLGGFTSTEFRTITIGELSTNMNEKWQREIATIQ